MSSSELATHTFRTLKKKKLFIIYIYIYFFGGGGGGHEFSKQMESHTFADINIVTILEHTIYVTSGNNTYTL